MTALGAEAPRRMAIVIGQSGYKFVPRLPNAANDASDMAKALKSIGFDVKEVQDASFDALSQEINSFVRSLQAGDAVFFYYAGHGIQGPAQRASEGIDNYLVPVDASIASPDRIGIEALALITVQERLSQASPGPVVFVLDACRNNPFSRSWQASGRDIKASSGLAAPATALRGTFLAYATAPGDVASENSGHRNGLFTQEILKRLNTNQNVGELFADVSEAVDTISGGKQRPWSSAEGKAAKFQLVTNKESRPAEQPQRLNASGFDPREIEVSFWNSVANSSDVVQLRAYLAQFPAGIFAAAAQAKIVSLSRTVIENRQNSLTGSETVDVAARPNISAQSPTPTPLNEVPAKISVARVELDSSPKAESNPKPESNFKVANVGAANPGIYPPGQMPVAAVTDLVARPITTSNLVAEPPKSKIVSLSNTVVAVPETNDMVCRYENRGSGLREKVCISKAAAAKSARARMGGGIDSVIQRPFGN